MPFALSRGGLSGIGVLFPYAIDEQEETPFIIDENLGAAIKAYLPAGSRTTVECGMRKGTPDLPFVLDLCQREEAMLVTADIEFPRHIKKYQRSHNDCCWGLMLLPADEAKANRCAAEAKTGKNQAHSSAYPGLPFRLCSARQPLRQSSSRSADRVGLVRLRMGRGLAFDNPEVRHGLLLKLSESIKMRVRFRGVPRCTYLLAASNGLLSW